jgi:haloacetate dehalogenase
MFPGFQEFNISVSDTATLHGVRSPGMDKPPLLLIHGFPQTHHIYHLVAPHLAKDYTLIIPSLKGYGSSSKPFSSSTLSPPHYPYSKSVMASELVSLMTYLGFSTFGVIGHDRGGRVAHKMCVDYPDKVVKCLVLDIAPTLAMFEATDQGFATDYWHWFFLIQPAPFPENLILANHSEFKARFFGGAAYNSASFMDSKAVDVYVAQFASKEGVSAMCEDYRAAATTDLAEARADIEEGKKVKCPFRCLWGKKGVIEKRFDALGEWAKVCEGEVSGEGVESGHYIPEEVPDVLIRNVKEFFT